MIRRSNCSPSLGIIKLCRKKDIDLKRPSQRWCLYSKQKPGKVIGRHPSRRAALRQERAIQIRRHRR